MKTRSDFDSISESDSDSDSEQEARSGGRNKRNECHVEKVIVRKRKSNFNFTEWD